MDGELPGVEHRQIREHVLRCQECSGEYEALLRMKRMLAQLRVREPQNDLASRILQQVHQADDAQTTRRVPSRPWLLSLSLRSPLAPPSQLALAASLLFAIGFALAHLADGGDSVQWRPTDSSTMSSLGPAPINLLDPTSRGPETPVIQAPTSFYRQLPRRDTDYPYVHGTFGTMQVGDESITAFAQPH
jgi:hypothetical protein